MCGYSDPSLVSVPLSVFSSSFHLSLFAHTERCFTSDFILNLSTSCQITSAIIGLQESRIVSDRRVSARLTRLDALLIERTAGT